MSTAMEPQGVKADASSGRLLRFTVRIAAAVLVITAMIALVVINHVPESSGQATPRTSAKASTSLFHRASSQMSYHRGGDGHYHVEALMNDMEIRFVVDPGTPDLMLSWDDARVAGLDTGKLNFSARAVTPGGEMRVASVIIPMMTIKQLTLFNVKGVVTENPMPTSVLGMGFLKRFDSYDMRADELVLRW